jgi:hypothetical protein
MIEQGTPTQKNCCRADLGLAEGKLAEMRYTSQNKGRARVLRGRFLNLT